jgi:hypothetical protein
MRIIESRSIDNQAGLLGSRLITGTNVIEGAFQSFIVAEDTVVTKVYNSIGIDVTGRLGLTSITLKAGAFISMPKGDYFSSIKLASGSIVAYFTSHGGMSISADAYLSEFLSRTGSSYLEASECVKAHLQQLINAGLLQKASLIMSPSKYEEDLVKSVVPQDGSGDLSFTRASDGTRINSAGLVEDVPWNLLTYSEEFNNAIWTKSEITISANSTNAPNGTTTADTLIPTTVSAIHRAHCPVNRTSGNSYTLSVYAKASGYNFLFINAGTAFNAQSAFNLSNGTISTTVGTASIESVGNGWYRCIVIGTASASGATTTFFQINSTTSTAVDQTFTGDGTSGIYLWGAQLNIGSTAKPYFPTTDRLNVPRLTYQNGGGGCPSLLLEPQRTNLAIQSNTFNTSPWAMFAGPAVTPNSTISPDGTQNATTLNSSGGSNDFLYQTITGLTTGATYAFSFYVKNINSTASQLWGAATGTAIMYINWSGETLTSVSGTGSSFIAVGNGWYRITSTTATAGTGSTVRIYADGNNTSKSIYIYGAQFEASSYPTSYIPTTSSSATRVIDDCRKTGISSLIGQSEGTMFIDLNLTAWDSNSFYFGLYGGGNEIYFRCAGTGAIDFVHYFGATQAFITKSGLSLGRHKLAACYKNNDWAFYVDGILVGTDTSGTFSGTISQMVFGYTSISAYPPFQSVNQSVLFPTRLTNAELASLTTI